MRQPGATRVNDSPVPRTHVHTRPERSPSHGLVWTSTGAAPGSPSSRRLRIQGASAPVAVRIVAKPGVVALVTGDRARDRLRQPAHLCTHLPQVGHQFAGGGPPGGISGHTALGHDLHLFRYLAQIWLLEGHLGEQFADRPGLCPEWSPAGEYEQRPEAKHVTFRSYRRALGLLGRHERTCADYDALAG